MVDGAILRLVLDKPARGNALSPSMMLELASALREAAAGGRVRAAILRGEGERAFCTGYDLAELKALTPEPGSQAPEDWAERFPALTEMLRAVEEFPAPTIAAVNGHAIGGGALLVSFCDLRVARRGVRFQIPASKIGVLYPLEGIRRLVSLIGASRATSSLLRASTISDEEGLAWGLYDSVVEGEELDAAAEALAAELSSRAPLSVQALRAVVRGLVQGMDEEGLHRLHHQWTSRCLGSRDLAEGLGAALERREPRFEGR